MKTTTIASAFKFEVSPTIGEVSAEIVEPQDLKAMMTLAHGAGAGMQHSFMQDLSAALATHGLGTMRFNFPYMELKKKRPDFPAVAKKTVEASISQLNQRYPAVPLFSGGKSFGGRMTSQWIAEDPISPVRALVFFGFPLHAPGKPSTERALHLKDVKIPMLFLQGTKDTLAEIGHIRETVSQLNDATLIEFDGADHSFKAGRKILVQELADNTSEWLQRRQLL